MLDKSYLDSASKTLPQRFHAIAGDTAVFSRAIIVQNQKPEAMMAKENKFTLYIVKPGDNLTNIASNHSVDLQELIEFNKGIVKDPNVIREGQELRIPLVKPAVEQYVRLSYNFYRPDIWLNRIPSVIDAIEATLDLFLGTLTKINELSATAIKDLTAEIVGSISQLSVNIESGSIAETYKTIRAKF